MSHNNKKMSKDEQRWRSNMTGDGYPGAGAGAGAGGRAGGGAGGGAGAGGRSRGGAGGRGISRGGGVDEDGDEDGDDESFIDKMFPKKYVNLKNDSCIFNDEHIKNIEFNLLKKKNYDEDKCSKIYNTYKLKDTWNYHSKLFKYKGNDFIFFVHSKNTFYGYLRAISYTDILKGWFETTDSSLGENVNIYAFILNFIDNIFRQSYFVSYMLQTSKIPINNNICNIYDMFNEADAKNVCDIINGKIETLSYRHVDMTYEIQIQIPINDTIRSIYIIDKDIEYAVLVTNDVDDNGSYNSRTKNSIINDPIKDCICFITLQLGEGGKQVLARLDTITPFSNDIDQRLNNQYKMKTRIPLELESMRQEDGKLREHDTCKKSIKAIFNAYYSKYKNIQNITGNTDPFYMCYSIINILTKLIIIRNAYQRLFNESVNPSAKFKIHKNPHVTENDVNIMKI